MAVKLCTNRSEVNELISQRKTSKRNNDMICNTKYPQLVIAIITKLTRSEKQKQIVFSKFYKLIIKMSL